MKKFTSCICNKANGLGLRARTALSNQRGDFYISDAVKIIIAALDRKSTRLNSSHLTGSRMPSSA